MMSTGWILASATGVGAALVHLLLTWLRAMAGLRGWVAVAMLTLPVAIVVPAACLFTAVWFSPSFAWLSVLSYWLIRTHTLVRLARP